MHPSQPTQSWDKTWSAMKADLIQLIGIPYRLGAEARYNEFPPKALDCSELVELVYARQGIGCPDGSWNQFEATRPTESPRPGDIGFFKRLDRIRPGNPHGIYHVGMIFSDTMVVEARAKDSKKRYGKVIYRPRKKWEKYEPFKLADGWRRLKVLF